MCVSAVILRASRKPVAVTNLGQIARQCGIHLRDLPLCDDLDIDPDPNFCLCVLNMSRFGQMTGMEVAPPSWDPADPFGDCVILRSTH